jgi:hypothetical protein
MYSESIISLGFCQVFFIDKTSISYILNLFGEYVLQVRGTLQFFDACTKFGLERGWDVGMEKWNSVTRGPDGRTTPQEERDRIHLAAPQLSVFRYQHKIREAFNPNDLGDAYYETLEDS